MLGTFSKYISVEKTFSIHGRKPKTEIKLILLHWKRKLSRILRIKFF